MKSENPKRRQASAETTSHVEEFRDRRASENENPHPRAAPACTTEPMELAARVDSVVGLMVRRRTPAPREDLCQEAWSIALAMLRQGAPSYAYNPGIRCALQEAVARWLAPVTLSRHACETARDDVHRVDLLDNVQEVPGPDELVADARWRHRIRVELVRLMDVADPCEREVLMALVGLHDGDPCAPTEVAARYGLSLRSVYHLREKLVARARASIELQRLAREIN